MFKRKIEEYFTPGYDELTLYLMSITILLLIATNVNFNIKHFTVYPDRNFGKFIVFIVFFIYGLVLPIYHVFVKKEKTESEKWAMLFSAIVLNAVSGIYAGAYVLQYTKGWLIIFPIWNAVNSIILLILLQYDVINTSHVSSRDATIKEIVLSTFMVLIIFYVCQYVYIQFWAITFSICVSYASNINKVVFNVCEILVSKVNTA